MDISKKCNPQIQINDLIADAVTNAVTRRGRLGTEAGLLGLSDEEAANIAGGLTLATKATQLKPIDQDCPPIVAGMIALPEEPTVIKPPIEEICEPAIVGLIYVDPSEEIA